MLSDRQMTCLRALVDTIIPADDIPGGWEAGVGEYLIRQLNSDLASQLTMYRIWLDMLDAVARAKMTRTLRILAWTSGPPCWNQLKTAG